MTNEQLKINYERALELNNILFSFLKDKIPVDISIKYQLSYESEMNISEYNQNSIYLKLPGFKNSSIMVHCYIVDSGLPFILSLWKYNGNHFFKKIDFIDTLSDEDFCL